MNSIDKLPLTRLESLHATAVVLSYYGYNKDVKKLLFQLSKQCKEYWDEKKAEGFLIKDYKIYPSWRINLMPGSSTYGEEFSYPDKK